MAIKLLKKYSADPQTRMYARWDALNKGCKENRFELYKPHLAWLSDQDFIQAKNSWKASGLPNDRRFFLYNTAKNLKAKGDTADIGVRYGTSSFFILKGINDQTRRHHLFDSFEGVSAPTAEDGAASSWKKGDLKTDESVTRKNLSAFDNCTYYKGWIPERFGDVADSKFALIHIDVDLYQPTIDSLQFFYNRLTPGGIIICDDYGSGSCPGAKQAFDEFFADKPESITHIPTGQCLVVKLG